MTAVAPIAALRVCVAALVHCCTMTDETRPACHDVQAWAVPLAPERWCSVCLALRLAEAALAGHATSHDDRMTYRDGWRAGAEAMRAAAVEAASSSAVDDRQHCDAREYECRTGDTMRACHCECEGCRPACWAIRSLPIPDPPEGT